MYKIYINDRPLTLCTPLEMARGGAPAADHLVARYTGKRKFLLNYVDLLEKASPKVSEVTLFTMDLDALWDDFKSHYEWVPAAGGVVYNFAKQWLLLYRRGSWDLPKGKIDKGETHAEAALREVKEETGLRDISLGPELPTTYHTYRGKDNQRVLKPTYWYRMFTDETTLVPQAEEDIEQAVWMAPAEFFKQKLEAYNSIMELLKNEQNMR